MRRRDLIAIGLLSGVIFYSWQQLQPPTTDEGVRTIDDRLLQQLLPWHGPIGRAQAASKSGPAGTVKGSSTEGVADYQQPEPLLPVETYQGRPFLYSVEEMLTDLSVTVAPEDIVKAFPDPSLGLGSVITIYRATPIEVTDWGKKKTYRTWQKTVAGFFEEQGLELGENDRAEPKLNEQLTMNNEQRVQLVITRVAITEVKQKEKIEFKVIEKEDPELPRGQRKVEKGELGERTKVYKVTRENGVEIKRELISNEVTKEPKSQTVTIGTKIVIGKSYTGRASWYKYDSTKVATDLFKRGTELRITNLNNGKVIFVRNDGCICADTGYVVDLHPDHFKALGGTLSQGVMQRIKVDEVLN